MGPESKGQMLSKKSRSKKSRGCLTVVFDSLVICKQLRMIHLKHEIHQLLKLSKNNVGTQ